MVPISRGEKIFKFFNNILMLTIMILCILPLANVISISISSVGAASSGKISLFPKDITFFAYKKIMETPIFFTSFLNSVKRVGIGVPLNIFLIVTAAFPLSLNKSKFRSRSFYVWFFMITTLVSGGLIPWYLTISKLGLINSFWSLILPGAVPVFNVIIMVNFFRNIPDSLLEAAKIDGAGYWRILWGIYVPCSLAAIATVTLFCFVHHWNEWFQAQILLNKMDKYPLQSYLQVILNQTKESNMANLSDKELEQLAKTSSQTFNAAQIVISIIPIMAVYPLLQKYFVTGITLGGVKE